MEQVAETSLELLSKQLNEVRKQVIGYFRFNDSETVELVINYEGRQVTVFHLSEQLAITSYTTSVHRGVLVLFDYSETLYTLKTTKKSHMLIQYYEKVRRPGLRPNGVSAYMLPGL